MLISNVPAHIFWLIKECVLTCNCLFTHQAGMEQYYHSIGVVFLRLVFILLALYDLHHILENYF